MNEHDRNFFDSGTPKTMFFFGLVLGVAGMLLVNTMYMYAGGSGLRLSAAVKESDSYVPAAPGAPSVPSAPDAPAGAPVKPLQADDHIRGNKNAKVVLIEYSDFQCPFCARHHPTMKQVMSEFPNDVAWVYRHFPLSFHPNAGPAAEASECASEQGKFWDYADKLIDNVDALNPALYEKLAGDLKLNVNKFKTCVSSKKYASRVTTDQSEGGAAGVDGTPATFINGKLVSGAMPIETFRQMIQAELAK